MKVLIADDNMISSRALAGSIEKWGYEVITARNGQEAWDALNEKHETQTNGSLRIALLDWEMPKISGIELCRRIRELGAHSRDYVYIILMTGRDNQEDILQGLAAGADDYMTKPFDFIELKIRLQNGERFIEREKIQEELHAMDALTRLWNRNRILGFLDDEINRNSRQDQPTAILLVKIAGLSRFNESDGYAAGDQILTEVATRLHDSIRSYDKLGRFGGDEFLGVFPNCREEHLNHLAERLRRAAARDPIRTEAGNREISVFLGGASSSYFYSCRGQELLAAAQKALEEAETKGGNTAVFLPSERKH